MSSINELISKVYKEPIIGITYLTNNEIDFIRCETKKCIDKYCLSSKDVSEKMDKIVFLGCINALKNWVKTDESSVFKFLALEFGHALEITKIQNYIYSIINRLSKTGVFVVSGGKKYYGTLLFHSFSPKESVYSFFNLCWRIFTNEMCEIYTPNDSIFNCLANKLRDRFISNKEEEKLTLGSDVYSLMLGFKTLARDHLDLLSDLIDRVTSLINKLFYGEKINTNIDYFASLVKSWWDEIIENSLESKNRNRRVQRSIATNINSIYPKYILTDDNEIYLTIPSIRFDVDEHGIVILKVFSDDTEKYDEIKLSVKTSGLLCTVKGKEIKVSNYNLSKLRIEIVANQNIIYNSRNTLFRDFILFSLSEKELVKNHYTPGTYLFYCQDLQILKQAPNQYNIGNNLYEINPNNGDIIQSNSKTIFFDSNQNKRTIWLDSNINDKLSYYKDNIVYDVVDGPVSIALDSDVNINDYGIIIENTKFRLTEFEKKYLDKTWIFTLTDLCVPGNAIKIKIFLFSKNQVIDEFSLIRFDNIQLSFDKEFYYGEVLQGKLNFKTQRFQKEKIFSIVDNNMYLEFQNGFFEINIPIFSWRLGLCDNMIKPCNSPIWYDSINNGELLEINIPENMKGELVLSTGHTVKKNKYGRYLIGELLHSLSDEIDEKVSVKFVTEKFELILFDCCLKEFLTANPVIISERDYKMSWYAKDIFIGPKNPIFKVVIFTQEGKQVKCYENVKDYNHYYFTDLNGVYSYAVYYLKEIGFEEQWLEIYKGDFYAGDRDEGNYKEKCFKFDRVILDNNKIYPISWIYIDNISFNKETNNYTCLIYFIAKGKRIDFYKDMKTGKTIYSISIKYENENRIILEYSDGFPKNEYHSFYLDNLGRISTQGENKIKYFILANTKIDSTKNELIKKTNTAYKKLDDKEQKKERTRKTIYVSPEKLKKINYKY